MSRPHASETADRFVARDVYAAYPHCNAFFDGGRRMVVGDATAPRLLAVDVEPDATPALLLDLRLHGADLEGDHDTASPLWFDVALDTPMLATTRAGTIFTLDLADEHAAPTPVYTAGAGDRIDGLVSISADGSRISAIEVREEGRALLVIHLADARVDERLLVPWLANHVQFCPADEQWIGFAHEGRSTDVDDRVWASHPLLAPDGIPLADQHALADDSGQPLAFGHERWMFHHPGAVVVAYGEGAAPRGVWELPGGDGAPRLVSAGERDWHCGISRDGTRIVVDTTGPADAPGVGWTDAGDRSSIVVIDAATGARATVAETHFRPHPFHPHPAFTPDGARIVFNRVDADGTCGVAVVDAG